MPATACFQQLGCGAGPAVCVGRSVPLAKDSALQWAAPTRSPKAACSSQLPLSRHFFLSQVCALWPRWQQQGCHLPFQRALPGGGGGARGGGCGGCVVEGAPAWGLGAGGRGHAGLGERPQEQECACMHSGSWQPGAGYGREGACAWQSAVCNCRGSTCTSLLLLLLPCCRAGGAAAAPPGQGGARAHRGGPAAPLLGAAAAAQVGRG